MNVLVSVSLDSLSQIEEALIRRLRSIPVELDLGVLDRSSRYETFVPLLAAEIESFDLDVKRVRAVLSSMSTDSLERALSLLDYLNVDRLTLNMSESLDVMLEALDIASSYGVSIAWHLERVDDLRSVTEMMREALPHKLEVALDASSMTSLSQLIEVLLVLGDHVGEIYLSNRSSRGIGIPIFSEDGVIDYLKVLKALAMLRYDGDITLRYRQEYYKDYEKDFNTVLSTISSVSSGVPDESLKRLINFIAERLSSSEKRE